ncbi:site-2 protease family protein, partial [Mesorhizobium sp. M1E.F.Ca.ET.041.01.1.1]
FLAPVLTAASGLAGSEGHRLAALLLATLAGCASLFNIANLVPVWKFDGGQVLRQICPGPLALALASFLLLSALLALGWRAGFPPGFLLIAGAVFSMLSLLTVGSGVKPRHELKPIRAVDRLAMAGALLAVFAIHGYGVLWASAQLM